MQVEQFIINHIFEYPLLYKDIDFKHSREKVLDQLFFTNGNGLDWIEGELRYCYENKNNTIHILPENYFFTPLMSTEDDELPWIKEYRIKEGKEYKPREICSKEALTIYPICDYAAIANIPEDIKLDWLLAAEDACFIAADYFTDPYKHCNDIYIKEWIKERQYTKIKKHLEKQIHYIQVAILKLSNIKRIVYSKVHTIHDST